MAQADAVGLLFETVHRRKDGTTFPVEVSSRGADLGGDRVLLSIIRDITDRRRAAHALATRSRQLEAVQAITAEITRELDLEALLALIHRRAIALVGGSRRLALPLGRGGADADPAGLGRHSRVRWGPWPMRPGEGLAGTVAAQRTGLLVNDYRDSPVAHPRFLAETGIVAALAEPLLYHERLVGVIVLNSTQPGRTFGDEERALLALVAQHAAIAIENARLFRAERDRRAQLEALRATTADLTRELDLTQLLRVLIARAAELVGASSATVYLWESAQGLVVPAAWHGLGDYQATIRHGLGQGIAGTVAQTRQGVCANDYRTSRYANPVTLHHTAVTASMGEPLLYRDELIGALTLNHEGGRTFSAQDQAVLRLFADQAAIAIKNARLYTAAQQALTDLRQAQEELIRAEKLRGLGQMAAGIAHDLNNTLATILGQTELLRLRTRSPAVQEGLETLQTAATDGAAVVRRLQDFARQRGAGPLGPCDLTQLVTETLEITRPRWREEPRRKGSVIEPTVDLAGLPLIEGQPAEIREALTNLVFNAVDAMPDGGHLRFTGRMVEAAEGGSPVQTPRAPVAPGVELDTPPPAWVELTVADTGIGMTDEVRGRIFDPFFTTKGLHGTGLGLSVVYGIMERHGGRIDVTSAPGQGTSFRLRFRAAPQDAAAGRTAPHVGPGPLPAHPPRRRRRPGPAHHGQPPPGQRPGGLRGRQRGGGPRLARDHLGRPGAHGPRNARGQRVGRGSRGQGTPSGPARRPPHGVGRPRGNGGPAGRPCGSRAHEARAAQHRARGHRGARRTALSAGPSSCDRCVPRTSESALLSSRAHAMPCRTGGRRRPPGAAAPTRFPAFSGPTLVVGARN